MRLSAMWKSWRTFGSTVLGELMGGLIVPGPQMGILRTLTYSAAPAIDASLGNSFVMTVTDNVAFVFAAPTNTPPTGYAQWLFITIRNTSGGAHGAGTFDAVFHVSAAVPAIATGQNRTIAFQWVGAAWVERWRTAADVPN